MYDFSFVCSVTYETLHNYIRNLCVPYTKLTVSAYESNDRYTIAKTEKI